MLSRKHSILLIKDFLIINTLIMKTQLRFLKGTTVLFFIMNFCFSFTAKANTFSQEVLISQFNGTQVSHNIKLNWEISNYNSTSHIQLEKSIDGLIWELVESFSLNQKEYEDTKPATGYQYYRLKQVDSSSEFYYSAIVAIDFLPKTESQIKICPNPTKGEFCVKLPNEENGNASIKIYSYDFQQIMSFETTFENKIHIDFSNKPKGIYSIEITQNGSTKKLRFIKE